MECSEPNNHWIKTKRAEADQARLGLIQYVTSLTDSDDAQRLIETLGRGSQSARASRANTERAYRNDQRSYIAACQDKDIDPLCPPSSFWVDYFSSFGTSVLKKTGLPRRASTVYRAAYGVRRLFFEHGLPSPTGTFLHRDTMIKIARADRRSPRKAKPLVAPHSQRLIASYGGETLRSLRDRAIAAFGVTRGFRSATTVHFTCTDITFDDRGIKIGVRDDKTNLTGETIFTVSAHTKDHVTCLPCCLKAYVDALQAIGITDGPLFRAIDRWGHLAARPLSPKSVTALLRRGLTAAGIPDAQTYSSHSYRHGVIQTAIVDGWPIDDIMLVTMHRSRRGIFAYINAIDPWYFAPRQLDLTRTKNHTPGAGWSHVVRA